MVSALHTPGKPAIRLSCALLFSVALHVAAILGIGLIGQSNLFLTSFLTSLSTSTRTLEVTLTQHRARPEEAHTEPYSALVASVSPRAQPDDISLATQPDEKALPEEGAPEKSNLLASSLAIIRQNWQQQTTAPRPRIKRLTSLSTAARSETFYLNSWHRKIENIGNLNYPKESTRQKIYGSLRLMVAILPDGSLHDIKLLESSGHQILDDAAVRIVRLAAPFAPFPNQLRETTDLLEIVRTWQFQKNDSFGSFPG